MTPFYRLSAAGFAATAIAFGPARMGFGLFASEFRDAFALSSVEVGFIASLGFLGFFAALMAAQATLLRMGPAPPIVIGLVAATTGLGVVALASEPVVLAAGVFLAATSAGFAWTPFNDAVHRGVADAARPSALSAVSTGTAVGIAAAGAAALAAALSGLSWRVCWAIFAAAAALALVGVSLSVRGEGKDPDPAPDDRWRRLRHPSAGALYVVAFAFGATSAIYIAFAADRFAATGGVPGLPAAAAPAVVFIAYGLFGLAGLATGRVKAAIGLSLLLRLLMVAGAVSLALVAAAPGGWTVLVLSAGLQGVHVMMTSAVLAFWAERLFPVLPATSFTAALLATAAGSVLGPAATGLLADAVGAPATFLAAAALPASVAVVLRRRHARERPAQA
jgi:predicted MFS family arabinose efflux permease